MSPVTQLCTFKLEDLVFGIEVEHVQEVLRWQELSIVPLASSIVRGLINLRGNIVTAIDVRASMGFPVRVSEDRPLNVVVKTQEGVVSLLVDAIGDVVEVDPSNVVPPPHHMQESVRAMVRGVLELESSLVLVLDVERVVDLGESAVRAGVES
jgi:purine-binding chemotaxis protein CheW